jgi:hypothetical protein
MQMLKNVNQNRRRAKNFGIFDLNSVELTNLNFDRTTDPEKLSINVRLSAVMQLSSHKTVQELQLAQRAMSERTRKIFGTTNRSEGHVAHDFD